ncbi:MAG: hypothetical protein ACI39U_09330, partial [Candidatus Cryptobacteroides sp.]
KIIDSGTPDEIVGRYPDRLFAVTGSDLFGILRRLRELDGVLRCHSFGASCHVAVDPGFVPPEGSVGEYLASELEKAGFGDVDVRTKMPCIEDCFMRLS